MGNIQNKKYYNKAYLTRPGYDLHYKKSEYYPLWQEILKLLETYKNTLILDIGCGTGQFAQMLKENDFKYYYGFDFSKVAIEMAKRKVSVPYLFIERAIMKLQLVKGLLVCLETLEHIIDDIKFLRNHKSMEILFTVPDFNDPAHIRYFDTGKDVLRYYKDIIEFERINKFDKYFICKGVIK